MLKRDRAKLNWTHWLHIHGLDTFFPKLPPLEGTDFDRKFYQRPDNEVGVGNISAAIYGASKTQIQFTPGHGATTMFRAVLRRLNSQPVRRLHIAIDGAEYLDGSKDLGDLIWKEIHRKVFLQLLASDWFTSLYGNKKQSFQLLFDYPAFTQFSDYLDSTRTKVLHAKAGDIVDKEVLASFKYRPDRSSLGDLFETLFLRLGVDTILLFDVPRIAPSDDLLSLMSEIKAFDEEIRRRKDYPAAAISEVYFGTAVSLQTLEATYHRDYHKVVVPPYNRAEVFKILTNHYGVQTFVRESVISILSASYLDNIWSASKSLDEMMEDLKQSLLGLLDCSRDKVSFGMFQDPVPPGGRQ
jgi:hypothetical protein